MALIECPECGRKVSDMATACPTCGYPVANNPHGTVYIKIQTGVVLKNRILSEDGTELAVGRDGDVVSFRINKPTNIRITCGGFTSSYNTVEPGKTYSYVTTYRGLRGSVQLYQN